MDMDSDREASFEEAMAMNMNTEAGVEAVMEKLRGPRDPVAMAAKIAQQNKLIVVSEQRHKGLRLASIALLLRLGDRFCSLYMSGSEADKDKFHHYVADLFHWLTDGEFTNIELKSVFENTIDDYRTGLVWHRFGVYNDDIKLHVTECRTRAGMDTVLNSLVPMLNAHGSMTGESNRARQVSWQTSVAGLQLTNLPVD